MLCLRHAAIAVLLFIAAISVHAQPSKPKQNSDSSALGIKDNSDHSLLRKHQSVQHPKHEVDSATIRNKERSDGTLQRLREHQAVQHKTVEHDSLRAKRKHN